MNALLAGAGGHPLLQAGQNDAHREQEEEGSNHQATVHDEEALLVGGNAKAGQAAGRPVDAEGTLLGMGGEGVGVADSPDAVL